MLLRSDRIYIDILQHELFASRLKSGAEAADDAESIDFNLNVHVHPFRPEIDPGWEFRGFVSQGCRTGLTAYNPWFFDQKIVQCRSEILAMVNSHAHISLSSSKCLIMQIEAVWDEATPLVKCADFSIDFAVTPSLTKCFIVEVITDVASGYIYFYLVFFFDACHHRSTHSCHRWPALVFSGTLNYTFVCTAPRLTILVHFSYHDQADRDLILSGPFEFRVKETPTTPADFVLTRVDPVTGEAKAHMIMQPAPPHVMEFMSSYRNKGIAPPQGQLEGELETEEQRRCDIS